MFYGSKSLQKAGNKLPESDGLGMPGYGGRLIFTVLQETNRNNLPGGINLERLITRI